jgi:hypothetical protein
LHIQQYTANQSKRARRNWRRKSLLFQQLGQYRLLLVAKQYNLPSPDGPISPEAEGATLMQQANYEPVYVVPMDVDTTINEEDRLGHVDERDVREDEEVGVEEGILEIDPIVESDESEPDQFEDKVTLEEEELWKDHQGLDLRSWCLSKHLLVVRSRRFTKIEWTCDLQFD